MTWQPMETAPQGGGAESVDDPAWVEPPKVLLLFTGGEVSVARWDWYYAPGGNGHEGVSAWIEPVSGELVALHYGEPVGWQPVPAPPENAP